MQKIKIFSLFVFTIMLIMCVPPSDTVNQSGVDKKKLDSLYEKDQILLQIN